MRIIDIGKEINITKKEFQILASELRKYLNEEKAKIENFDVIELTNVQFEELKRKQEFLDKFEHFLDYTARHFKGWESLMKDFLTSANLVNDVERIEMILEMYIDLWFRHWELYAEKFQPEKRKYVEVKKFE
jgi:hypothetical protein